MSYYVYTLYIYNISRDLFSTDDPHIKKQIHWELEDRIIILYLIYPIPYVTLFINILHSIREAQNAH